ncbi:MAG: preprotein translocase subunit SecE [Solirubrobacteraceae bacterium]
MPGAGPEPVDGAAAPDVEPVVDGPTLDEVDLDVGAPPEDLGVPTSTPPEDLGVVTGELPEPEDEFLDEDPRRTAEAMPAPSGRPRSTADGLAAEDELLPAARQVRGGPPAKVGGNRVTAFLRASWAELQRVQWPNRRQVGQATAVVLGFVVIAGGYLGLADLISSNLVDAIL